MNLIFLLQIFIVFNIMNIDNIISINTYFLLNPISPMIQGLACWLIEAQGFEDIRRQILIFLLRMYNI